MIMGQQLADNCMKMPLKMPFAREKKKTLFIYGHRRRSIFISTIFNARNVESARNAEYLFFSKKKKKIGMTMAIDVHAFTIGTSSHIPVNLDKIYDSNRY